MTMLTTMPTIMNWLTHATCFQNSVILSIVFALCILATRIATSPSVQKLITWQAGQTRGFPLVPYWIPGLGHSVSFLTESREFFGNLSRKHPSGLFSVRIGGVKWNIIGPHDLALKVIATRSAFERSSTLRAFADRFCGGAGAYQHLNEVDFKTLHKTMRSLNADPHVSKSIASLTTNVQRNIFNLVSLHCGTQQQTSWAPYGKIDLCSDGKSAHASLFPLIRHFTSAMMVPYVFGESFLSRNPQALEDLFVMDARVLPLVTGLPSWVPFLGIREARFAQKRLHAALQRWHEDLIDPRQNVDTCALIMNRVDKMREIGLSSSACAAAHLALFWAMNANINITVFWMLFHIYQDSDLLNAVRDEIAPYFKRQSSSDGNMEDELAINSDGLKSNALIIRSVFVEALRLHTAASTTLTVERDITIENDDLYANAASKHRGYALRKGELLCIPHYVQTSDPKRWENPSHFQADRFLARKPANATELSKFTSQIDYHGLPLWGFGEGMCKGQKYTERAVFVLVAAILECWEIEAVGESGWQFPGYGRGAATRPPSRDVRVKIKVRET